LLAKIFEEAGLFAGVLSAIVFKTSEIGDELYTHPIPQNLSSSNSIEVRRRSIRDKGRTCCQALNIRAWWSSYALVVLENADIGYAAKSAVFGRYLYSGQICMSANRIIVHESIFDEFCKKFVEYAKALKVGDPSNPEVLVDPLIDEKEAARVVEAV